MEQEEESEEEKVVEEKGGAGKRMWLRKVIEGSRDEG